MSTRAFHSALRALAAAMLLTPAATHAQARTPPLRSAPAEAQLLPSGTYELILTPATADSHPFTNAAPIPLTAQVVHAGAGTTITTSDSITLRGASSATHLKASGAVHGATLTLELGGSGTQASGTWSLRGRGTHQAAGTVTVALAPRYQARTSKRGGCSGFFDCVKQVTGYDWGSFFGG